MPLLGASRHSTFLTTNPTLKLRLGYNIAWKWTGYHKTEFNLLPC